MVIKLFLFFIIVLYCLFCSKYIGGKKQINSKYIGGKKQINSEYIGSKKEINSECIEGKKEINSECMEGKKEINSKYKTMYIKSNKYKTYLEIHNKTIESDDIPIIIIHGVPGASFNYLIPMSDININEPIIFYDQINSGKSSSKYQDNEIKLYHFTEQLEIIIKNLKIKKCHLIGHSFGAIIAQEFYLKNKSNVETIIFYSPSLSLKLWQKQANIYMNSIIKNKEINYYDYHNEYTKRHIGDLSLLKKYLKKNNNSLYKYLWEESEYNVNGIFKNYKYNPITTKISILFISGEYDTASKNVLVELSKNINNYKIEIINNSRHISHLEKPTEFNNILISFFKNYYKNKFHTKHIYYENKILNNNLQDEIIMSNKLIYIYMTYGKNKNKLYSLLKNINNYINIDKKQKDIQSFLDFWYFTKILGYKDKYKPNKLFLKDVYKKIENDVKNPYDAVLNYIYIRTLMYCEKKYYSKQYFDSLEKIIKKNLIMYGYYLTHIILYDLKFGYINISELENKSNINWAITELNILLSNNNLLDTKYADLLGEISLCFKLCNIKNNILYLNIYNILNRVKIYDFHLIVILGLLSY